MGNESDLPNGRSLFAGLRKSAARYGVIEQMKAENQMEWVRQMNACKAQAEAIVKFELIYD